MYGVFLIEDESIIRETLRDTVPWNQYGFTFLGEASDGEMALSQIRQLKPDVILTDIRMPFMDGLDLSRMVRQEFPWIKIIILSGYDDFDYARQALNIGVDQYLVKPVTKNALIQVLVQLKGKMDDERARQSYQDKFRREGQQYEQYARRDLLERMVAGQFSLQQIYEHAKGLDLDLRAQCYDLAFFTVFPEGEGQHYSEPGALVREALLEHFLKYPEYVLIRWNLTTYAVLIMGEQARMDRYISRCVNSVRDQYERYAPDRRWYVAVSTPTRRLSMIKECYEELSKLWAYRLILPREHILTRQTIGPLLESPPQEDIQLMDGEKVRPAILRGMLEQAGVEEVESFVRAYLGGLERGLSFQPFCHYLLFSIFYTAVEFVQKYGVSQQEFVERLTCMELLRGVVSLQTVAGFGTQVLSQAIQIRDQANNRQSRAMLQEAVDYIDHHFQEEGMGLNQVAQKVNISANYLSAVFSQEMGRTFVEYVTGKRMELARELLRTTDLRSGEVAAAVGYRDPHYFSFLFKKTQGCTPRDYRNGEKGS